MNRLGGVTAALPGVDAGRVQAERRRARRYQVWPPHHHDAAVRTACPKPGVGSVRAIRPTSGCRKDPAYMGGPTASVNQIRVTFDCAEAARVARFRREVTCGSAPDSWAKSARQHLRPNAHDWSCSARHAGVARVLPRPFGWTPARDLAAEVVAFLTRALKAPTLRESVDRLAERARAETWSHEVLLVACSARPAPARPTWRDLGRVPAVGTTED